MRKALWAAAAVSLAASLSGAVAADGRVKLGLLTDMGGVYADITGPGSIVAAQLAIEDFGGKALGRPIELVTADHQAKPDIGLSIARKWLDSEGVDAIVDVPVSSIGLGIQALTREKNRIFLNTAGASSDFTGKACSPLASQWAMDTYTMASSSPRALVKAGGDKWFFITADYAFGHALERDAAAGVKAAGGTVVGSARHPLNNQDFSSLLLQAQGSAANVIGLANGTGDTVRPITPASYREGSVGLLDDFPGMTCGAWQQRPESRGHVRLRSASPQEAPLVQPNYLDHETDRRVLVAGIRLARRFLNTPALAPYLDSEELPGADAQTDAELLDFARTRGSTVYHLIGTCRMGPAGDPTAVVDDELRVRGLQGLRVVDASIMPAMPSANTNASTLMIAEKAADLIRGRTASEG